MSTKNMTIEQEKVALVTGSSSGVGFQTALLLSKSGYFTYASMRNLKKSGPIIDLANKDNLSLRAVQLDVKDDLSVRNAISKIVDEKGRIDVLVNNAGYGLLSPIEDVTLDQVKELFETNFFGVVRVIKKVLPIMRRQKKGTIVNVSSNVGRVGMPLISAYAATKAALEGLSESIRYELNGFGINIILIEPGLIKTNFAENSEGAHHTSNLETPYAELIGRTVKGFGVMMDNSSPPKLVADAILNAVSSEEPEIRYLVGDDAQSVMKVRKSTSDKEFENWMHESVLQQKGFVRGIAA